MAQVGIKSSEGFFYPITALEQAQGPDVRLGDLRFNHFSIRAEDCAREPEVVRPVLQPGLKLDVHDIVLQISVVDVSGIGPFLKKFVRIW